MGGLVTCTKILIVAQCLEFGLAFTRYFLILSKPLGAGKKRYILCFYAEIKGMLTTSLFPFQTTQERTQV